MYNLYLEGAILVGLVVLLVVDFFFVRGVKRELDVLYNVVYRINSGKKVTMEVTDSGDLKVSFDTADHLD